MIRRRCSHSVSFALIVFLAATANAQAGYETLRHELEGYHPPVLSASQMTPSAVPTPATIQPAPSEFQTQIDALNQRQDEWRQALTAPKTDEVFYPPNPGLITALQATANDPAAAAQALSTGFTLETLETLVLLRNPAIQARESQFKAVLEGYSQVEDLDTSLRQYATLTKSLMTGVGGMTNPDQVALKFPFPGLLALKGEIVNQEAQAAREELEATRREALTSSRKDYAELLYSSQAREVTKSLSELLEGINNTVAARYQSGGTSFQDVTASGIEREKIREELTTIIEEQSNVEAAIRANLSLAVTVAIGAPAHLELQPGLTKLDQLYALALAHRQELKGQQAMIGRMERMLEMAETMVYPGFSQDLSLFDNNEVGKIGGEESPTQPNASFPVTTSAANGIGAPKMPWFGLNDAYLRQTRQRILALKKDLATGQAATTLAVRMAWFRLDRAQRQKALYQDRVVPLAQANLDTSQQSYAAGQGNFEKLIQSATSWLTAKLTLARANADVLTAGAELDAAVGVTQPGMRPL